MELASLARLSSAAMYDVTDAMANDATVLAFTSASDQNAAEIVALHEAVERHRRAFVPEARTWKVPSEDHVLRTLRKGDTILARAGTALVGSLRLDPARGFPGIAPFTAVAASVYLLELAVHPAYRRLGVGRRCLEEAERRSRAIGAQAIRLDTNADAFHGAAFYSACGYRKVLHYSRTVYFERLL